jgi:hypothetical protein
MRTRAVRCISVTQHRGHGGHGHNPGRKYLLSYEGIEQCGFASFELANAGDEEAPFLDSCDKLPHVGANRIFAQLFRHCGQSIQCWRVLDWQRGLAWESVCLLRCASFGSLSELPSTVDYDSPSQF